MRELFDRELEYQALRKFIKTLEHPTGRLIANLSDAVNEELTERQKMAVHYYYIEQKPMREIAEIMGVCVSTVSRTLKRARKRLRRCLKYGGQALIDEARDL